MNARRRRTLCAAALPLLLAAGAAPAQDVRWYTLGIDGVRIGYVRSERSASADASVDSETVRVALRELGRTEQLTRRIVLRQDAAGHPLAYDYEMNSGTTHEGYRGTFEHGVLHIHPTAAHAADATLDLPPETTFAPDLAAPLAPLWQGAQTEIDVVAFDPQHRSAGLLHARVVGEDADGRHVRVDSGSAADAAGEDLWFDAQGRLRRAEQPMFGARVSWTPCTQDCAADVDAPLDFMSRLVVRSPVRIPDWDKHRTLRFVLTRSDGAPVKVAATDEQAVVFGKQHAAILTICEKCGAAEHPSAEELARYLAPNAWVQSDNAEIRALARNTVSPSQPVDLRMKKLARLVKQRMHGSNDFLGYGSALDALHTGSGDCTEFSVLLAAFARSQGIPTRIAMGMAYSDRFSGKKDVFSPHVWVQAWNGRQWTSYDAGLDGFDSTHIALAVGSGEPDALLDTTAQLAVLRMENAGVVRQP